MTAAKWTADGLNMLLIALIICVFVLGVVFIKRVIEEGLIRKRGIWIASIIGFLLVVYLIFHIVADLNLLADLEALSRLKNILPADWTQIFLVLGLVTATGFYTLMAFRQAKASAKIAREMREQRLSEAQPYLLMRLEGLVRLEGDFDELVDAEEYEIPSNFKINVKNEGKDPAINIRVAFWRSDNLSPFQPKGYLAPQEEWQTTISPLRIDVDDIEMWLPKLREIVKYDYPGTIAIEYRDIHECTWVTYLQLQKYFLEENYIHIGEGKQSRVEIGRTEND